jgi:hypothetical protein
MRLHARMDLYSTLISLVLVSSCATGKMERAPRPIKIELVGRVCVGDKFALLPGPPDRPGFRDRCKAPLPHARVVAASSKGRSHEVQADANGAYRLTPFAFYGLPGDSLTISGPTGTPFVLGQVGRNPILPGPGRYELSFVLDRAACPPPADTTPAVPEE